MWIEDLVSYANSALCEERELEALWSRGVTDVQISDFRIGYIRSLPLEYLKVPDFSTWWKGKRLTDVFVLPLTNALGQVKGLQFRHVVRESKGYQDFFLAKDEPVFFGLHQAMPHVWKTQSICLVEGVFDLLPVARFIPETVPTLTARVSKSFLAFLRRNVTEIRFLYDFDKEGRNGSREFVEAHFDTFSFKVPGEHASHIKKATGDRIKDPSDAWETLGDEGFGVWLKTAFVEAKVRRPYVENVGRGY